MLRLPGERNCSEKEFHELTLSLELQEKELRESDQQWLWKYANGTPRISLTKRHVPGRSL